MSPELGTGKASLLPELKVCQHHKDLPAGKILE